MNIVVQPGPLRGRVEIPASKSVAHRAMIAAALADRPTQIVLNAVNDDLTATAACLNALGAACERTDFGYRIVPAAQKKNACGAAENASGATDLCEIASSPTLDCGESGSTLRFLLPVAAALTDRFTITGHGRLPQRPLGPLRAVLETHGCTVRGDGLPLSVSGSLKAGEMSLPGNVSSQFVSGLLLAAPLLDGETRLQIDGPLESAGYVDMTCATMGRFGAPVEARAGGFLVRGGGYRSCGELAVEGDWSNAAFFLAARSMGHAVEVSGLDGASMQPDRCCEALFQRVGTGAHLDVSGCPTWCPCSRCGRPWRRARRTSTARRGCA